MKLAKKIRKHLSRGASSAKKGLSKGVSASRKAARRAAQFAAEKALTRTTAAYLAVAIIAVAGGTVGYNALQQRAYKQGCIDGGAVGMITIVPFAAGDIVQNRHKIFDGICGELGQARAKGKGLDDLLK